MKFTNFSMGNKLMKYSFLFLSFILMITTIVRADIETAKVQCADIGFKPGTEKYADCVMKLMSKEDNNEISNNTDKTTKKKDKKVMTYESEFQMLDEEKINKMRIIIKSDVAGTSEAIVHSLTKLGNDEVEVDVVFSGVGGITESDVNLAATTNSKVVGFNVRSDNNAKKVSEELGIEIIYYSVIYDLIEDVKRLLSGLLEPIFSEKILGLAQVKEVFKSSEFGMVAGCIVTEGTVKREKHVRVLRDNVVIHEGELDSLRRVKDDVKEVQNGTECGIGIKNYTDIKSGDIIENFEQKEEKRSL